MSFTPDYVGMLNKIKDKLLDFISKLDKKYGEIAFSSPVGDDEILKWEQDHSIKIPDDYKEWLSSFGETLFPTVPMHLFPPSKFQVNDEFVIIGKRNDLDVAFRKIEMNYVLINGTETKNLGHMETIIRNWIYDMQEIIHNDTLLSLRPQIEKESEIMKQKAELAMISDPGVKEAMEYHFSANLISYLKKWGTYPKCPVRDEDINCGLVISKPDYDGYYQWQPLQQTIQIDFERIEDKLGFRIHKDIKEFISSYFHFQLEGYTNVYSIWIYGLLPTYNIERVILDRFNKSDYAGDYQFILNGQFFFIGAGCIDGDDSHCFEVDNTTGEVLAVQYTDQKYLKVEDSIKDLFLHIKPIWD